MNYAYNKHTGEKIYIGRHGMFCFRRMGCKDLGDALMKGWTFGSEDYEEPKEYWCIDWTGGINKIIPLDGSHDKYEQNKKEIGNYFETKEEAELAVQKLKAWKRLKDCGFKFVGWKRDERYSGDYHIEAEDYYKCDDKDLDLVFGGEE